MNDGSRRDTSRLEPLDVGSLLTIDVASEVRKVPGAMRDGPWQVPAELVRWTLRSGARSVHVHVSRGLVEVRGDGSHLAESILEDLVRLLDERAPLAARHAGLVGLEAAEAWELAGLASAAYRELVVERHASGPSQLMRHAGASPRLEPIPPSRWQGTRILLRGANVGRERATRWLERVCRFSPVPIALDGRGLVSGFERSLGEIRLEPELEGRLSLSREGQTACLWLLSSGILTAHASLPGLPGLEAAVEMAGLAGSGAGPGSLREAIGPRLELIERRGLELLLALAGRAHALPAPDATRLRSVLLAAARQRRHMQELLSVRVFPSVDVGGASTQWSSLLDLGRVAAADDSRHLRLYALYPGQNPASFSLPNEPVFILDGSERATLSRLLGIRFRPPPRRAGAAASWQQLRHAVWTAARAAYGHLSRVLAPATERALPPDQLSPRELRLLRKLAGCRREQPPEELRLWDGRRSLVVGRGRSRQRLLPRSSPELRRALDALDAEPGWIYPACLALLGEAARPSQADRSRWRERRRESQEGPAATEPHGQSPDGSVRKSGGLPPGLP